ncbi:hypothetical protein CTAM01_13627 [Colletotrichum tamarilloi]|uniref:Uncharacterized protein n=1 Tax=Colletotrichum tamarilloi TaxID=1209934 RepID=A0ABQ9QRL0_9PEZI|nr:uncharacterized protein CTAM01_13627 [Colletotrichum tamarilloi]KAK1482277.1 hypothetical protein CTAM01_13627 [Colletotrichum tamarilloi]
MGPTEPELNMSPQLRRWHKAVGILDLHRKSTKVTEHDGVLGSLLGLSSTVQQGLLCPAAKEHVEMNEKKFQSVAGPPTFQPKRSRGSLRGLVLVTP